ncbi:MAG: hypothetical protein AAFY41_08535 [Bacteroidota bacterium]
MLNIKVVGATSGIEGFAMAQNINPVTIFVDLLMPEITWDGYQTIEKLKSHSLTNVNFV